MVWPGPVLGSASPLLEYSDIRVRLLAAEVCTHALQAVASIDACLKPEEGVYETVKRLHPHDVPETHSEAWGLTLVPQFSAQPDLQVSNQLKPSLSPGLHTSPLLSRGGPNLLHSAVH